VKFIGKAYLAFGDCALLMSRAYDLSYAVKQERIRDRLAPGAPDAALLIGRYRAAVKLKEWGDYAFLADYPLANEFEIVRKYYLRFFQWYETSRAKVEGTELAARGVPSIPAPDVAPLWKAAIYNVQAFGARALAMGAPLWREHPRASLYRSLPLLLGDEPVNAGAIARLFQMSETACDAVEKRFYQLQKRFS
jgi:hypothetical protein